MKRIKFVLLVLAFNLAFFSNIVGATEVDEQSFTKELIFNISNSEIKGTIIFRNYALVQVVRDNKEIFINGINETFHYQVSDINIVFNESNMFVSFKLDKTNENDSFFLNKINSTLGYSEWAILFFDKLTVIVPENYSYCYISPEPDYLHNNLVEWAGFNWNKDIELTFMELKNGIRQCSTRINRTEKKSISLSGYSNPLVGIQSSNYGNDYSRFLVPGIEVFTGNDIVNGRTAQQWAEKYKPFLIYDVDCPDYTCLSCSETSDINFYYRVLKSHDPFAGFESVAILYYGYWDYQPCPSHNYDYEPIWVWISDYGSEPYRVVFDDWDPNDGDLSGLFHIRSAHRTYMYSEYSNAVYNLYDDTNHKAYYPFGKNSFSGKIRLESISSLSFEDNTHVWLRIPHCWHTYSASLGCGWPFDSCDGDEIWYCPEWADAYSDYDPPIFSLTDSILQEWYQRYFNKQCEGIWWLGNLIEEPTNYPLMHDVSDPYGSPWWPDIGACDSEYPEVSINITSISVSSNLLVVDASATYNVGGSEFYLRGLWAEGFRAYLDDSALGNPNSLAEHSPGKYELEFDISGIESGTRKFLLSVEDNLEDSSTDTVVLDVQSGTMIESTPTISVETIDNLGNPERVFKSGGDVNIRVVAKNPNDAQISGQISLTVEYEDESVIEVLSSETVLIPANDQSVLNFVWDSQDYARWLSSGGFEFIGKKFRARTKISVASVLNSSSTFEFYVDEFGVSQSFRNLTYYSIMFDWWEDIWDHIKARVESGTEVREAWSQEWESVVDYAESLGTNVLDIGMHWYSYADDSACTSSCNCSDNEKELSYWWPASTDENNYYITPPLSNLIKRSSFEDIGILDISTAREMVRNITDIAHNRDMKIAVYLDPIGIYDPDHDWGCNLSSSKNSRDSGWAIKNPDETVSRIYFCESIGGWEFQLGNPEKYTNRACPYGQSNSGYADDTSGFSPEVIDYDLQNDIWDDPSYHYNLVKQFRWLVKNYEFDIFFVDDTGRLVMGCLSTGSYPIKFDSNETCEPPLTYLAKPSHNNNPYDEYTDNLASSLKQYLEVKHSITIDYDDFTLDSYANMLRHVRWQLKNWSGEKALFSSDYFVPWDSIAASEDGTSTDQFRAEGGTDDMGCHILWSKQSYESTFKPVRASHYRDPHNYASPIPFGPPRIDAREVIAWTWANRGIALLNYENMSPYETEDDVVADLKLYLDMYYAHPEVFSDPNLEFDSISNLAEGHVLVYESPWRPSGKLITLHAIRSASEESTEIPITLQLPENVETEDITVKLLSPDIYGDSLEADITDSSYWWRSDSSGTTDSDGDYITLNIPTEIYSVVIVDIEAETTSTTTSSTTSSTTTTTSTSSTTTTIPGTTTSTSSTTTTISSTTSTTTTTIPTTYTCDSCSDCEDKVNSADTGDTIYLTTDITNNKSCIDLDNNGITFDCQNHTITDADGCTPYGTSYIGIYINYATDNIVKNCMVTDFCRGIELSYSSNNTLMNNVVNLNRDGITLSHSQDNILTNNTIISNGYGITIWFSSSNNTIGSNHICNNQWSDFSIYESTGNSGDDNTCDNSNEWNDTGTTGCTYSCTATTTTSTSSSTISTTTSSSLTTSIPTTGTIQTTSTLPELKGDLDGDGIVSDFELLSYIDLWVQGEVTDFDLLEAIDNWAAG